MKIPYGRSNFATLRQHGMFYRILADGEDHVYESIVRGTGFVRTFYSGLKAATGLGGLVRTSSRRSSRPTCSRWW